MARGKHDRKGRRGARYTHVAVDQQAPGFAARLIGFRQGALANGKQLLNVFLARAIREIGIDHIVKVEA